MRGRPTAVQNHGNPFLRYFRKHGAKNCEQGPGRAVDAARDGCLSRIVYGRIVYISVIFCQLWHWLKDNEPDDRRQKLEINAPFTVFFDVETGHTGGDIDRICPDGGVRCVAGARGDDSIGQERGQYIFTHFLGALDMDRQNHLFSTARRRFSAKPAPKGPGLHQFAAHWRQN